MRILVIWGESLGKPGSGTVHCHGLCRGLLRDGHEVTILTPGYAGMTLRDDGLPMTPIRLPKRGLLSFLLFQLLTVLLLGVWLIRYRPKAVYVRTCFFQGMMALICRLFGAVLIAEVDSVVDEEIKMRGEPAWAGWLVRRLDGINHRLVHGLVCVTKGLRDEAIRRGSTPEKTIAIPNGAMVERFVPGPPAETAAAREALGWPTDVVVVGFAGALSPWQGLDFLVEGVEAMAARTPAVRIALMGEGPMEGPIRKALAEKGIESRFFFVAQGGPDDVVRFLHACDGAVIPIHDPRKLAYGLSALKFWDAISMGLAVLVPAGSELDETLAELNLPGTFSPDDPATLATALVELHDSIEPLRLRRDEIHRQVCRDYSWDEVARQVALFLAARSRGKTVKR